MKTEQQKKENLNHFCNFNKKKNIFNLNCEEYAVFLYIWLLYTIYVAFLIYLFYCVLFFCPIACN